MGGWAAAAQAGAQVVDTGLQVWSAMAANESRERIAKQTWTRQKEAMQSRYQWTMEDMRKAGLNPILAYQQGGGSPLSAPSANVEPVYQKEGLSSAVARYREAEQWAANQKILEAQDQNVREDTAKKSAEIRLLTQERINREIEERIMKNTEVTSAAKATQDAITEKMYQKYPWLRQLDILSKSVQGAGGAVTTGKQLWSK